MPRTSKVYVPTFVSSVVEIVIYIVVESNEIKEGNEFPF